MHDFSEGRSIISVDLPTTPQGWDHLIISRNAMAGVWSLMIPPRTSRWFPPGFPAWPLSKPPAVGLSLPPMVASTKRIHRVFQQTASCTLQRHRWEGQHPFACLGVSYLRTVIVRHRHSPCRHGARTISSSLRFKRELCVWHLRISIDFPAARTRKLLIRTSCARWTFPADCPHRTDCHCSRTQPY